VNPRRLLRSRTQPRKLDSCYSVTALRRYEDYEDYDSTRLQT